MSMSLKYEPSLDPGVLGARDTIEGVVPRRPPPGRRHAIQVPPVSPNNRISHKALQESIPTQIRQLFLVISDSKG